jgi:hypothetical protein
LSAKAANNAATACIVSCAIYPLLTPPILSTKKVAGLTVVAIDHSMVIRSAEFRPSRMSSSGWDRLMKMNTFRRLLMSLGP